MRTLFRLALGSALVLAPVAGAAQDRPRSTSYEGVIPGTGHPPPATGRITSARGRRGAAAVLTWPGFQAGSNGRSRFFVQTTGPLQIDVRAGSNRVEVTMRDTRIHLRNSALWLETAHFDTPVTRARLERRGRDMVLVLMLRAPVTPTVTQATGEAGYSYLYVDFPEGDWLPEPAPAPVQQGGSVGTVSSSPSAAPAAPVGPARHEPLDNERPPGMGPNP